MKKRMFAVLCVLSLVFGLLLVNSMAIAADKVVTFRFGTTSFPGLPTHAAAIKYAELIKEKTNGRYILNPIQEG